MARRLESIQDVVDANLCSGCGACAFMQPSEISMVDVPAEGLRPRVAGSRGGLQPDTSKALAVCPGIDLEHPSFANGPGARP
jgi:coenzyme F420 hydrogenase subunit beta